MEKSILDPVQSNQQYVLFTQLTLLFVVSTYIGPIYGRRFSPGKIVRIQGTAPVVAFRFDVSLQCGSKTSPRDDIAVQVSVRILDGYISINSLENGIWGEEQHRTTLPIKRAENFEIILLCDFNQYKVAINGQHYYEFFQRIHYDRITHLTIDGDVAIIRISYESAAGDGMETALENKASEVCQATAPLIVPLSENQLDDFELIDSTTTTAASPGLHPPPPVEFSGLPSCEPTTHSSFRGSTSHPFNASSACGLYPTGDPCPKGPEIGSGMMAYPAHGAGATPYSVGAPGAMNASLYTPPGAPGILLPPLNAPVPLNATSSNLRPVGNFDRQKAFQILVGIFAVSSVAVIIVMNLIIREMKAQVTY